MTPTRSARPRGFTIIELVAVVALIALLLAILLVAFRRASNTASRTASLGALRQLSTAMQAYASDHDQALMPGQVSDAELQRLRLKAFTSDDRQVPVPDLYRNTWVWRLTPYMSDGWEVAMADDRDVDATDAIAGDLVSSDSMARDEAFATVETRPSFGMNTFFLGGDDVQGDDDLRDRAPWRPNGFDSPAARSTAEIRNPSRLMAFAASIAVTDAVATSADVRRPLQGGASLRPPFTDFDDSATDPTQHVWTNRQWEFGDAEYRTIVAGPDGTYDLATRASAWPVARWGDDDIVPCAHMDGSTSSLKLEEYFFDMRLWAPQAGTQRFAVDAP